MTDLLYDSLTFVVLFGGEAGHDIRVHLEDAVPPEAKRRVYIYQPRVPGLPFLSAAGQDGEHLDLSWHRDLPPSSFPVFLIDDEPTLEEWVAGTDGCWFMGVKSPARARAILELNSHCFPLVTADPFRVMEYAMAACVGAEQPWSDLGARFARGLLPLTWVRDGSREAEGGDGHLELAEMRTPLRPRSVSERYDDSGAHLPRPPRRRPQPISYDPTPSARPVTSAPPRTNLPVLADPRLNPGLARVRSSVDRLLKRLATGRTPASLAQLGPQVNAHRPIFVGFASRKGGVGKTTYAAATAATVGESLNGMPDTAALVDGNINNPDSWALNPPPGSATVRELVSRLTGGFDPPPEQYAKTPRLAIYPESRDSEEAYTQAEIDIVAEYLRRRHAFVAIDLPNALPSLTTGGPGAAAAAWLAHCDAVVLPFNADPRARQGMFEYLEALRDDPELAAIPVVAPYIASGNRLISRDPAVLADISSFYNLRVELVEVPDDNKALVALLRDRPINQASPALRAAYLRLTEALIAAVIRARRQN